MSPRPPIAELHAAPVPTVPRRILFLDDDPARAEIFLAENPEAVWVQTADECIARLEEDWDEVHLDHDLGGERFVDLQPRRLRDGGGPLALPRAPPPPAADPVPRPQPQPDGRRA